MIAAIAVRGVQSPGIIPLGAGEIALAALLVLLCAGASLALQLKIEKRLLFAALRATVQVLLLGYILRWVFEMDSASIVVVWMIAMALLAGFEAVRRTSHRVRGLRPVGMLIMLASSMAVTLYALVFVLDTGRWWEPQYAIPILGMVLGNTLNGISLGIETCLAGFVSERASVELLLAHGATRAEAARGVVRRAVRTGLLPVVNMMVAAGLVSIPGMMTGQILAGEDPAAAARYQLFILFCIAGGVALGTLGAVFLCTRLVFDARDRLRPERVRPVREG